MKLSTIKDVVITEKGSFNYKNSTMQVLALCDVRCLVLDYIRTNIQILKIADFVQCQPVIY